MPAPKLTDAELAGFALRGAEWKYKPAMKGCVVLVMLPSGRRDISRLVDETVGTFQARLQQLVDNELADTSVAPLRSPAVLALAQRRDDEQRTRIAARRFAPPTSASGHWERSLGKRHAAPAPFDSQAQKAAYSLERKRAADDAEELQALRKLAEGLPLEPHACAALKQRATTHFHTGTEGTAARGHRCGVMREVEEWEAGWRRAHPQLLCGCPERGVCLEDERAVKALRVRLHPFSGFVESCDTKPPRNLEGVGAWYLPPGHLDQSPTYALVDRMLECMGYDELKSMAYGEPMMLSDTEHPQPERRQLGVCSRRADETLEQTVARLDAELEWPGSRHESGAALLAAATREAAAAVVDTPALPASFAPLVSYHLKPPATLWPGSHIRPLIFALVLEAWNAVWHRLDEYSQKSPPNSVRIPRPTSHVPHPTSHIPPTPHTPHSP